GTSRGAVYVLTLTRSGAVATTTKFSSTQGVTGELDDTDEFGWSASGVGDLDGDGDIDVAVGAPRDDDGSGDAGAFYVIDLAGPVDTDGDGLWDVQEDANTDSDGDPTTTPGPDTDGDTDANFDDADDDGDTVPTRNEMADPNGDGDPRDAVDVDRDGQPDYLDGPQPRGQLPVADEQKISSTAGGLTGPLDDGDDFGQSVTSLGDLDGDGVNDLAVGAIRDDDGGTNRGAVHVLFMNADGTVRSEQKISSTEGGLTGPLDDSDEFGHGLDVIGDVDGDGVNDIIVGGFGDDDGGPNRGAAYVVFLRPDGTVKAEQKISDTTGGFQADLTDGEYFGSNVSGAGDIDGDGVPDVIVNASRDDDGGTDRGAVYVLFLNPNGTVKAEQKISSTQGGLTGPLVDSERFGLGLGALGDVDGDGVPDIAVGSRADDGGPDRGAIYVLFLNRDGTVRAEQKISDTTGGLDPVLADNDRFGGSIAGVGDIDGNGVPDLVTGTSDDDDGGTSRGTVYLLTLDTDGTVLSTSKLSSTVGGLTGPLDDNDWFGRSVTGLGDLDDDGALDIAVGARRDDDGGSDRGAVYVLDLSLLTDADGDGLWDVEEDQNADADRDPATNPGPDTDGDTNANFDDADDDGDGVPTISENADPNGDGDPRDARDIDQDGQPDYLDIEARASTAAAVSEQKISETQGALSATLADSDWFGASTASIGDVDGDGIADLAVGAPYDGDGGTSRGAVYVLFLNADGSVRAEQKISSTAGGLVGPLSNGDLFGDGLANAGDVDGDGVNDLLVGAPRDGDGGVDRGAAYVLFLNDDGTVRDEQKLSSLSGGLGVSLTDGDRFGSDVTSLGDLDGDGVVDVVVGAPRDDSAGTNRGAAHVLFLNSNGTVKTAQTISDTSGGLGAALDDDDLFGSDLAGLGDLDGDGNVDLAVGAIGDDDGGSGDGAAYVLFLNADGSVQAEQKLSATSGGLTTDATSGEFGFALAGTGDIDGDGR
ncbi:MAG: integrin alpha, partial [Actinomycetota bacterium]